MEQWILEEIREKERLLDLYKEEEYMEPLERAGAVIYEAVRSGHKLLLAGNGGSAADAQHFAGEVVGRFLQEREAWSAVSLCTDPSVVTCIGNDYGYEEVFARQVQGIGEAGDVLLVISASGNSENILRATYEAHRKGMTVIGLLGRDGGAARQCCDIALVVPSESTPRIQEMHTFIVHLLCERLEREMMKGKSDV